MRGAHVTSLLVCLVALAAAGAYADDTVIKVSPSVLQSSGDHVTIAWSAASVTEHDAIHVRSVLEVGLVCGHGIMMRGVCRRLRAGVCMTLGTTTCPM